MKRPYLSIVIPTYNRAEQLDRALAHLFNQGIAHESYEVIVVDDGSMDGTDKILKMWKGKWSQLTALHQKNSGQATARNRGIKKAQGQVILFGQDDIYASAEFLKKHIEFHQKNPQPSMACLGLTEWWEGAEVTPYMHWLTNGGPQFAYGKLQPNQSVAPWFFYTSNISLKADILKKNPFDESFKGYGWEDIELGYRLMNKGLSLIYKPKAMAWHDHPMDESSLKKRMTSIGKGAHQLEKKAPNLKVIPRGLKRIILRLIGNPLSSFIVAPLACILPPLKRMHWYILSKRYFFDGLNSKS